MKGLLQLQLMIMVMNMGIYFGVLGFKTGFTLAFLQVGGGMLVGALYLVLHGNPLLKK